MPLQNVIYLLGIYYPLLNWWISKNGLKNFFCINLFFEKNQYFVKIYAKNQILENIQPPFFYTIGEMGRQFIVNESGGPHQQSQGARSLVQNLFFPHILLVSNSLMLLWVGVNIRKLFSWGTVTDMLVHTMSVLPRSTFQNYRS